MIQQPLGEDAEAAARPPWQWTLIGSGLLVTIWTPIVALALALARKVGSGGTEPTVAAVLVALTFVLAAISAGYLVARFGVRTTLRHALLAGLVAAIEIWLLALLGGAFRSPLLGASAFLSLCTLASPFCALGAWLRRRGARPA